MTRSYSLLCLTLTALCLYLMATLAGRLHDKVKGRKSAKKRCHCHWQCHLPSAKCQSAKVCSNIHKIFPLTFPLFCLSICLSFSLLQFLWFSPNIADKRYYPIDYHPISSPNEKSLPSACQLCSSVFVWCFFVHGIAFNDCN